MLRLVTLAAVSAAVAIWLAALTGEVRAHSWYEGMVNELGQRCCGGLDCGPVPEEDVTPIPGGYQIHVREFGWNKVKIDAFVPNARAKPAKEGGEYHLCFWANEVKCFFFPAPAI